MDRVSQQHGTVSTYSLPATHGSSNRRILTSANTLKLPAKHRQSRRWLRVLLKLSRSGQAPAGRQIGNHRLGSLMSSCQSDPFRVFQPFLACRARLQQCERLEHRYYNRAHPTLSQTAVNTTALPATSTNGCEVR